MNFKTTFTNYDKKLLQSEAGNTKCGKKLLESSTDITKWDVTEVLRTFIIKESEKNL